MSWLNILATLEPWPADTSPFVDIFREHGVENTAEVSPVLSGCLPVVAGAEDQARTLAEALLAGGAQNVSIEPYDPPNWEENWKQFFKPRRIGQRFVVKPTWESFEQRPGDLIIELDPGRAFGTGDHPTTRLCLELMERVPIHGQLIADVGCGSGILAIGAKMLGADRVVASDIDPMAIEVSRENADLNQVEVEWHVGAGFGPVVFGRDGDPGVWGEDEIPLESQDLRPENQVQPGGNAFDVAISNIISMVLIKIAEDAYRSIKPDGFWIVSGIIHQNWPDVLAKAESVGFVLHELRREDDWVGATFRK